MQHTYKKGKEVTKNLVANMLHDVLIPGFGFFNVCIDTLQKLRVFQLWNKLELAFFFTFKTQNFSLSHG